MNKLKSISQKKKKPISQFELTKNIVTNLKQFELTPTAKLVLILLTTHYNPENGAVVFPSMPFISETLGIGLTAVKQSISDLIQQGLIIKSKRDKVSGNHNKFLLTLKVRNLTTEQPENELFKQSNSDLFMITNKIEQKKEQTVEKLKLKKIESDSEAVDKNKLSIEDFEKIKSYATAKGAINPTAYARTIINNGNSNDILNIIKQSENIRLNAQKRIEETKALIKSYEEVKPDPLPEELIERAKKIKAKLCLRF